MNDPVAALIAEARDEIAAGERYAFQSDLAALRLMYLSVSDLLRRLTDALEEAHRESRSDRV